MNSLILSLAPFGGLASALPAMAAAEVDASPLALDDTAEARSFALLEDRDDAAPGPDRDGGYLFL